MKELKALLSVKRLIALGLTLGFLYLSVAGKIAPEQYIPIYTMIIGYYFGQSTVNGAKKSE
jgi:hypothetical protein